MLRRRDELSKVARAYVTIAASAPTHAENLTLACRRCNLAKGTRPAFRFAVTRSLM